mgnify:CR=1 FL=1
MGKRTAIVGATGAVGTTMLSILEERDFPVAQLRLMASSRSAGRTVATKWGDIVIEDLEIGMMRSLTKEVTDRDIELFAEVSTDRNPVHLDESFARQTRFGGRIAHGMLAGGMISAVLGTRLPGPGAIYLSQELRFKAPVRIGDTVTARVEVVEVIPAKRRLRLHTCCLNQKGELVVDGEALLMLEKREG